MIPAHMRMRPLIRVWPLSLTHNIRVPAEWGWKTSLCSYVYGKINTRMTPAKSSPHAQYKPYAYGSSWAIRPTLGHTCVSKYEMKSYVNGKRPYMYKWSWSGKKSKFVYLSNKKKHEFPRVEQFWSIENVFWRLKHWRIRGGSRF